MMQVHGDWLLTPERAALHLPTATAVVADLHLGYDQVRRRGGEAVPAVGLEEALAGLGAVLFRHDVRRLVIAGDLFEDGRCAGQAAELLRWLEAAGVELTGVVPGNHDRGLSKSAAVLPVVAEGVLLGGWRVVHGDGRLPRGRLVHGHVHPVLRWGPHVVAPCYLVGERRIVLPAFSADAAGVGVLDDPRWRRFRCCAIADTDVLDFGPLGDLARARKQKPGRRV
jgi:putative SbcD/Mre11-related phosphoesterase